jgi:hypothetical protein
VFSRIALTLRNIHLGGAFSGIRSTHRSKSGPPELNAWQLPMVLDLVPEGAQQHQIERAAPEDLVGDAHISGARVPRLGREHLHGG